MAEESENIVSVKTAMSCGELRDKMLEFESAVSRLPGVTFGDDGVLLKHSFADGLYIREYTGIKGTIAVSKLHKTNHPYFVMTGKASVLTEEGPVVIEAPFHGITKAGTKRILYFHKETVWITVHATEETDLEKIEEQVIAKSYNELPISVKKELGIEGEVSQ